MTTRTKYDIHSLLHKFHDVNGDLYEYDLSNFINTRSYITIICKAHGAFTQRVSNHLKGQGCKRCSSSAPTKNIDDLLSEFRIIHKDIYSYNNIIFKGVQQKVEIICKTHGSFWQRPHDHRKGSGCPKCVGIGIEQVIERSKVIHNNYNYDNSTLKQLGRYKLIENVHCNEHGYFSMLVHNHLKGHGCTKCGHSHRQKCSIEERIAQAKGVHGDRYTYSDKSLTGSKDKAIITCPTHGEFRQTWANHISSKQGCKRCNYVTGRYTEDYFKLHPERKLVDAILYVISMNDDEHEFFKIGITTNFKNRMKHIPYTVKEVLIINDTLFNVYTLEQKFLNNRGYRNRYVPTKKFGGDRECFILPVDEILESLS